MRSIYSNIYFIKKLSEFFTKSFVHFVRVYHILRIKKQYVYNFKLYYAKY